MSPRIFNTLVFLFITICLQAQQKTLIIGIDGVRPDALAVANTPNIDNLIANGIYSPHALNDDITISGPGWSAILCGVWSEKHEVTGNDFTINNYDQYPAIFKYVEEYDPSLHTVSFVHWDPINDFIVQDHADFKLNMGSDLEVGQQAAAYLESNDPDIMFLHFDEVDGVGHSLGFSPQVPEYISIIEDVDTYVGLVMDGLTNRPNYANEDWLILATTDHGGLGFSHGGNSIEEQEVFFIASGPSVTPTLILKDSTIIPDNPVNCLGDSVELRFNGNGDHVSVPPNPIFDFGEDQDFTVEVRVRTNEAADVAIVGNKDWNTGLNPGFVFSFRFDSGPDWKVNIGDGTNRVDVNAGGFVSDNEWYMLSVSCDRDGLIKVMQDGLIMDYGYLTDIGNINTNQGLFFGADVNGAFPYNGAIAEVRVWDTVVHHDTVTSWACSPINESHPDWDNLIGYWKMNEGTGNIVEDAVGTNDGQIVGAEWASPTNTIEYDHSNTPRLPDVAVTALTHLCIPIEDAYDFDGNSWVEECMPSAVIENNNTNTELELNPNPANETVNIVLKNVNLQEGKMLSVFDATGKKVKQLKLNQSNLALDISDLEKGVYWFSIDINGELITETLVKF